MIVRHQLFIPDGKDTYEGWHVYAQTDDTNNPSWLGRLNNIRALTKDNQVSGYMLVRIHFDLEHGIYQSHVLEHKINPLRPRMILNASAKGTVPRRLKDLGLEGGPMNLGDLLAAAPGNWGQVAPIQVNNEA